MSGPVTRRAALRGSAAAALGLAAGVAPALARIAPAAMNSEPLASADATLIEFAGRVSQLAVRVRGARARTNRLWERVEALHPKPPRPVANDAFRAYNAATRPTEDRIGLTRLRKANRRSAKRLDRWSRDLAAMESGTAAGLAAKALAVLEFDDWSDDSEGAETLAVSVLHDAVRLGGGARG